MQCGANTLITDSDAHSIDWEDRRRELGHGPKPGDTSKSGEPVRINDDVWLGMNVTVLKGVEIGARTVVGAGSIVTHSLPQDCLAAGIPARVIRRLDNPTGTKASL